MNFPSSVYDLKMFERDNSEQNIRFHIWSLIADSFTERYRTPFDRVVDNETAKDVHIVLAPYYCNKKGVLRHHYYFVDNFDNFLRTVYPAKNGSKTSYAKSSNCPHCGLRFSSKSVSRFSNHVMNCHAAGITKINMPSNNGKDNFMKFNKKSATTRPVISIFFDIETSHTKIEPMCINCIYLYNHAKTVIAKNSVASACKASCHIPEDIDSCDGCNFDKFSKRRIIKQSCDNLNHTQNKNTQLCDKCEIELDKTIKQKSHKCVKGCEKGCTKRDRCNHSFTKNVTRMDAIMFACIIINNRTNTVIESKVYTGNNCIQVFLAYLLSIEEKLLDETTVNIPMVDLTADEYYAYSQCDKCPVCKTNFTLDGPSLKVRDHCHFSGKFRRALCQGCNLQARETLRFNVWAHNMSGFDGQLVMRAYELYKQNPFTYDPNTNLFTKTDTPSRPIKFSVIPWCSSKFKGISFSKFDFKDSYAFLSSSLSKLAEKHIEQLLEKKQKLEIILQLENLVYSISPVTGLYQLDHSKYADILRGKGQIAYDAITSVDYLHEKQSFPSKDEFYNRLQDCPIDDEIYEICQGKKDFFYKI
ncbi:MAG TPA: hypothetical protein EYO76_12795 [Flavobacteriaceae bacterium]|nr:hypothetical protein [Flavobacteriaceae bacterium]